MFHLFSLKRKSQRQVDYRFVQTLEALENRRLLNAGSIDTGFADNGSYSNMFLNGAQSVAVQSDGKIVVAGTDNGEIEVSRFNYDGTPDTSFGQQGTVITAPRGTTIVTSVTIDAHDRIIVAGYHATRGNPSEFIVLRYTMSGQLDTRFNGSGIAYANFGGVDIANSVCVQPNSEIIVAGTKVDSSGQTYFAVARFLSTGAIDPSFGDDGQVLTSFFSSAEGNAVAYDNGDIVVAGSANNGGGQAFAIAAYLNNGNLDTNFNGTGKNFIQVGTTDVGTSLAIDSNSQIVVGGSVDSAGSMIEFNADGAQDTNFGHLGVADLNGGNGNDGSDTSSINSLAIESDGKILAGGSYAHSSATSFAIARFTTAGLNDASFGTTNTPNGEPMTLVQFNDDSGASGIALSPDERIVAAGGSGQLDMTRLLNDVTGSDNAPPVAILTPTKLLHRATTRPYSFTVTYSDAVAVNIDTLGDKNILINGPNDFSQYATLGSVTPDASDGTVVATYDVAAPRKGFGPRYNGTYTITLQGRQVRDTSGNAIGTTILGTFSIGIA